MSKIKSILVGSAIAFSAFGSAAAAETVAFLMPDQNSTRYEMHDWPGFQAAMKELCPDCTLIYQNANSDVALQQQQFNSAVAQGASIVVLDPVDSAVGASIVSLAHSQNVKVITYDRPVPDAKADFYVSFDNVGIGHAIAESLINHLKETGVPEGSGILQINGSQTGAAGILIKEGVDKAIDASSYKRLAEFDTPDWSPAKAQEWAAGAYTRFGAQIVGVVAANDGTGGGAIAAFKAAGADPLPPVTGNDATIAALQLVIAGDQYNTISKPSEIVARAAAEVVDAFLKGETPKATTTLYDTPSQLFVTTVVTQKNIKEIIFDSGIESVETVCTAEYVEACHRLNIK